jgi:hypothetical protein
MFAIRIVSNDGSATTETNYHAYAYSVSRPMHSGKGHPVISIALEKDIDPWAADHRAINLVVRDMAYVMNETGKTIDRVHSDFKEPRSEVQDGPRPEEA